MKRIVPILLMVLLTSTALIGCGGDKGKENIAVNGPATGGTIDLGDGQVIDFGTAKQGESLTLPEKFPVDVLPLLDDAEINFVNVNESNQGIGITFLTDKSFDEAVVFYKEVMEDGKIDMQTSEDNVYMMMGSKASYSIVISITYQPGQKVAILLDATPRS